MTSKTFHTVLTRGSDSDEEAQINALQKVRNEAQCFLILKSREDGCTYAKTEESYVVEHDRLIYTLCFDRVTPIFRS